VSRVKEKITQELEVFPQVWKWMGWKNGNKTAFITVIYQNHSETYVQQNTYSGQKDCEFDPYNEVDMVKGHGGKRVHGMKTVKVIDFTR